jgi:KaiC/GvpD/RAD55 family RecA-like ATPase
MVKLEDKLKHTAPRSVVLIEVPANENPMRTIADFLRYRQNGKGIYISSNRPTKDLLEKLKVHGFNLRESLDTEKTCVIDLVSKSVGSNEVNGSINVASPSELSATQMAFEKAAELLDSKTGDSWLLLDSLSTLLVYNSPGALLHFLHFLVGRLRVLGFDGAIFTVEGSVEGNVLSTVRQFCDDVIKV